MLRIPSIHKYCNRWCDRCPFQQRCAFYLAQHDDEANIDWGEGLDEVSSKEPPHPFEALDLNEVKELEQRMAAREKAGPFDLEKSPLMQALGKWQIRYRNYLSSLEAHSEVQKLRKHAFLQSKPALLIDNALQVLEHYTDLIRPKVSRALGGKHDEINMASSLQSDWNGSAKVACLGLKHLRTALEDLFESSVDLEGQTVELLQETNRIIKLLYFEFPELDEFHRPGFDDLKGPRLSGNFKP